MLPSVVAVVVTSRAILPAGWPDCSLKVCLFLSKAESM